MKLKLLLNLSISILAITLLTQCKSDDDLSEECSDLSSLGEFETLASSKDFLPYPDDIEKIIFSNEAGEEFTGNVSDFSTNFSGGFTSGTSPCPLDSDIQIPYNWSAQITTIQFDFAELNLALRLSISPLIYSADYSQKLYSDYLSILLLENTSTTPDLIQGQMGIVIDERTHPMAVGNYSDLVDPLVIHGESYSDVYISNLILNATFELYFNSEVGVVGFKSMVDPDLDLKFVRVE